MPSLSLYLSDQNVSFLRDGHTLSAARVRDLALRGRFAELAEAATDPIIAHEQALAAARAAMARLATAMSSSDPLEVIRMAAAIRKASLPLAGPGAPPNPQAALVHETGTAPAAPPASSPT